MEELLEVTTWSQLGIHSKPVVLFNMKGYFKHLIDFIQHSVDGMLSGLVMLLNPLLWVSYLFTLL